MEYRQHFIPLESDPIVFTQLAHALGLANEFEFQDVFTLEEQPALAVILIYHTPDDYDIQVRQYRESRSTETEIGNEHIVWFEQTINNACALYGILHAILDGSHPNLLESNSVAEKLRQMKPKDQINEIESSTMIKQNYDLAAKSTASSLPDPEADVDYHYVTFVASQGRLIELDGDKGGPIDRGLLERRDEGALGPACLKVIEHYLAKEFHIIKLVKIS